MLAFRTAKQFVMMAAVAFTLLPVSIYAQTGATILGIVHDTAGQPIAGASVDAAGQKSGIKRKLLTDQNGAFRLPELPPDTYEISATCDTCNDASNIIEVGAGQARSIQLELDTNSSSTIVSLDTHATTLDATSARLGMNVTATEVSELPVNGRTFAALALAAPLVSNAGGGSFSDIRFSGQSAQQDNYILDNIDDSSIITAQPSFVPLAGYEFRLRNSLETVDEFRVDSAGYSVEDGMGTGAQIKLISKAATNGWHGSLFEYLRNDDLDARNFFDLEDTTPLRMNQYGASGGGGLIKDKLFLFGSFEKLKQRAGLNIFETVPSASARMLAVPAIEPALDAIPSGFAPTKDSDIDQARRDGTAAQDESNLSARVDYIPTGAHRLFFRYSHSAASLSAPDYTTTPRMVLAATKPDQMVASWTYQLAGGAVNQLTAGINRVPGNVSVTSGNPLLSGSRILIGDGSTGTFASPGDQISMAGGRYGNRGDYRGRSYHVRDAFDFSRGAHSLQAGVEWQTVRMPFTMLGGLTYTFRDDNSFLADEDADIMYVQSIPWRKPGRENYAGYIQDQWHHSTVQVAFGLRYEYFSATREAQNAAVLFDYRTLSSHAVDGSFYAPSKLGFEPRLTLTWSPKRLHSDTVLRLGIGIYDGPNALMNTLGPIENATPNLFLGGAHFPATPVDVQTSPFVVSGFNGLDTGTFGSPQRNAVLTASFQQALPKRLVAEIGYNGILSRHLSETGLANLGTGVDPVYGFTLRPDLSLTAVPYLMNGGNSSYNALALRLSRHLVDNLTLTASYNLSHSIGDTQGTGDEQLPQNPNCLACERSDNSFDIRQAFAFTSVYALPVGKGHPHLNTGLWSNLLGNWTVAAVWNQRSGLPLNVLINRADEIFYSPSTRLYYSPSGDKPVDAIAMINTPGGLEGYSALRPDLVPGVNPYEHNGLQWLNPAAFAAPLPGTLGNLGRNVFRGPGFAQLDIQLNRTFILSDRFRLKAKAEVFNFLNHPNFSNPTFILPDVAGELQPGSSYNSSLAPGFGAINSTVGRTVGLGTSRQIQLGVRLEF